jgi:hypothetical protein
MQNTTITKPIKRKYSTFAPLEVGRCTPLHLRGAIRSILIIRMEKVLPKFFNDSLLLMMIVASPAIYRGV